MEFVIFFLICVLPIWVAIYMIRYYKNLIIDTSVLMDGRILDLAKSGIINHRIIIPKSVISELQLLADGSDSVKRSRARRGLDLVAELQSISGLKVRIVNFGNAKDVDGGLISLAKINRRANILCTVDYNLIKVAIVQRVKVFNINELTKNLRSTYLPGEDYEVKLASRGNDADQAVAHMDDGSMMVVEKGADRIGQTVKVTITRSLQTDAGRMLFGKIVIEKESNKSQTKDEVKKKISKPSGRTRREQKRQDDQQDQNSKQESARIYRTKKDSKKRPKDYKKSNTRARRKTQSDREDSLISLVNKQR